MCINTCDGYSVQVGSTEAQFPFLQVEGGPGQEGPAVRLPHQKSGSNCNAGKERVLKGLDGVCDSSPLFSDTHTWLQILTPPLRCSMTLGIFVPRSGCSFLPWKMGLRVMLTSRHPLLGHVRFLRFGSCAIITRPWNPIVVQVRPPLLTGHGTQGLMGSAGGGCAALQLNPKATEFPLMPLLVPSRTDCPD